MTGGQLGGRLPDPGMDAVCAQCDQPRTGHGGPRKLGHCPGSAGVTGRRFSLRDQDRPPPRPAPVKVPPMRRVVEVWAMLAPWSLDRARWVAPRRLLVAMAEEYGTSPGVLEEDVTTMIMGVPVRVDDSVSGLLLEWR